MSRSPAITDKQPPELDYRVARYQGNPSGMIPREQVKADLFQKQ
jgi:hypothetical protein